MFLIKTIISVLKVLTCIITSIATRHIGLVAYLTSVSTFEIADIQYLFLPNFSHIFLQLATMLLEKEVMTYGEVERLIGPPPHGAKHKVELVDSEMDSLSNNSENDRAPENYAS